MLSLRARARAREHVLGRSVFVAEPAGPGSSTQGRRGIAASNASAFMPNETDNTIQLHTAVELLQSLEALAVTRKNARTSEEQDETAARIARIEAALPPDIHLLLRGRIRSGQPLVAVARNGKCRSCYTSMPKGDLFTLLTAREPVLCQYCGVLLFLDDEERGQLAQPKTA